MSRKVVVCISDLQIPFEHRDAFDFIAHVYKTFVQKGDDVTVVNMGDEVDQHTLGKFTSDPAGRSGGDELEESKDRLKIWFKTYPVTSLCISNHTWRVYKKAFDAGIPEAFLKKINEVYEAPDGWRWKQRWMIDGIVYEHGEEVSGMNAALNAAIHNRKPTVIGHQHSYGGVIYLSSFHDYIFGMNTGCLIDIDKYAFRYAVKHRRKPTLGTGVLIDNIPFFVPMILDQKKRWIKRLI